MSVSGEAGAADGGKVLAKSMFSAMLSVKVAGFTRVR